MQYTHKGWFFLCPIYLNADDGEGMAVEAKYEWLEWWFTVQMVIFDFMVEVIMTFNPDYEPVFPFRVTGKL
jgi:hypothetical protein